MALRRALGALLVVSSLSHGALAQDLAGHGGPVGALAANADRVLSGGFDTRAILWSASEARALQISRFHDGAVTGVAFLPDGFVTAGQDGRLALWSDGAREPAFATPRGQSAVASLDVSADGRFVVAGLFDGTLQVLDVATRSLVTERAHADRVTGVGFLPDGDIISVGADLRFSRWSIAGQLRARVDLPSLPNGLAMTRGRAAIIFADGALRVYSGDGAQLPERFLTDRPLVSVNSSAGHVVTGAVDGTVWTLAPDDLGISAMFRAGAGPVWGIAATGGQVFTSGADGIVRRWDAVSGQSLGGDAPAPPEDYTDSSRGAEIWRACAVCHSLRPDDHSRAGPSLHGIFGRPIASAPGYDYSPALRDLSIVWSPRSVAELFEFGPEAYTPGSRMPEQRVADPADRAALVAFIERATQRAGAGN